MKKHIVILLLISICSIFLISCDEEQIIQLQNQVQIEKQIKEKAQQDSQESKNSFNLMIGLSIAGGIFALITGVAMGSKSRKNAKTQTYTQRRDNDER